MAMRKIVLLGLAAALLHYGLPRAAEAHGDRATAAEESGYAAREAETPCLQEFVGGSHRWAEAFLVFIYVFYGLYYVLYPIAWLVQHGIECCRGHYHREVVPPRCVER